MKTTPLKDNVSDFLVKAGSKPWQPLIEQNIHYAGISVISLRYDEEKKRSTTILLKFEPGASYPYHNHPAGEEIYVLEGEAILEGNTLGAGDYLYTPANFKHAVTSKTGCTMLFVIPEEVEILDQIIGQ